jgi:hypothetical protein
MKQTSKKIDCITALRDDLIDYYINAREGRADARDISSISQLAGKIIGTAKTQLQYNIHQQTSKKIPFLEK